RDRRSSFIRPLDSETISPVARLRRQHHRVHSALHRSLGPPAPDLRAQMIILLHPRTVRPRNRRFPLAILSIAAMLERVEDYAIVDGNLDPNAEQTVERL